MAPIGWQVLAGLIIKAVRSVISVGVCRNSIVVASYMYRFLGCIDMSIQPKKHLSKTNRDLFPGVSPGKFGVFLPGSLHVAPDLAVNQSINLTIEIDRSLEPGVRTARIVAVQLLHRHA